MWGQGSPLLLHLIICGRKKKYSKAKTQLDERTGKWRDIRDQSKRTESIFNIVEFSIGMRYSSGLDFAWIIFEKFIES